MREVAVQTFAHVHTLSLRFHLERKTGGLSRVIERGTKGIDTLLSFALFSIFPTIFQLLAVLQRYHGGEAETGHRALHPRDGGRLYLVHLLPITRWRIAIPPRDEPVRHRRQHQGGGQPAQFRDREIFQQRDA